MVSESGKRRGTGGTTGDQEETAGDRGKERGATLGDGWRQQETGVTVSDFGLLVWRGQLRPLEEALISASPKPRKGGMTV